MSPVPTPETHCIATDPETGEQFVVTGPVTLTPLSQDPPDEDPPDEDPPVDPPEEGTPINLVGKTVYSNLDHLASTRLPTLLDGNFQKTNAQSARSSGSLVTAFAVVDLGELTALKSARLRGTVNTGFIDGAPAERLVQHKFFVGVGSPPTTLAQLQALAPAVVGVQYPQASDESNGVVFELAEQEEVRWIGFLQSTNVTNENQNMSAIQAFA